MNRNKGFTLIELLSVIVVLAIIALIAAPFILDMIEIAKKGSAKASGYGMIEAAKLYYTTNILNGGYSGGVFVFEEDQENELKVSGTRPSEGRLEIDLDGNIKGNLVYGKYTFYICNGIISEENIAEDCQLGDILYQESILNGAFPNLQEGMIPIYYNGNNWVVADIYDYENPWYSYKEKRWANVVMVTEASRSKYVENGQYRSGEVVEDADILTYLVWIPRYKYKIFTDIENIQVGGDCGVNSNVQIIDVVFEGKDTKKSMGKRVGEYFTHPAFTFGNKELNGIWVGKFETSNLEHTTAADIDYNNDSELTLMIKPNVSSWRNIQPAVAFMAVAKMNDSGNIYGLKENIDSHMMKNSEWGAVAYLSASLYGLETEEIRINNSSTMTTGCAATTVPVSSFYPDYLEQTDGSEGYYHGCENAYHTPIGMLASTTGNIYGIYDMSGGAWEYVMGVLEDDLGSGIPMSGYSLKYSSGFSGKLFDGTNIDGVAFPVLKYYDLYSYGTTGNDITAYKRGHLGDATIELGCFNSKLGSDSILKNFSSWHQDQADVVNAEAPWILRGSTYTTGVSSGIFAFATDYGMARGYFSFRVVLA